MRTDKTAAALLLFALLIAPTQAIVYSLRTGYSVRSIKQLLKAKKALTEDVSYNGYDTTLHVDVSDMGMSDVWLFITPALENFKNKWKGQRSIIVDIPEDGKITRLFIFNARPGSKTVIFQLQIPKDRLQKDAGRFWPSNVPRPVGVQMDQVMQLKKSKSFYGKFNSDDRDAQGLFEHYNHLLVTDGWRKVTNDTVGGVYMDANGRMLVFATHDGKDRSHGSVYVTETRTR